jgi:hypothetical protein
MITFNLPDFDLAILPLLPPVISLTNPLTVVQWVRVREDHWVAEILVFHERQPKLILHGEKDRFLCQDTEFVRI